MYLVAPIVDIFRYSLLPIAPFSWFGYGISTLDVVACLRLCFVLRQLREQLYRQHVFTKGKSGVEEKSFIMSLTTTLTVVYGGEAVIAPLLGIPPSFLVSGAIPGLYAAGQAFVDALPQVPELAAWHELPLSIVDGITRAYLLCDLIPPAVVQHSSPAIANSPWTLLVVSLATANAGFFFTNTFSLLSPTSLTVKTPPELQSYGWTTTDLWCAPAITGLYALLTHAQPFWVDVHAALAGILGHASVTKGIEPADPEVARAVCALLLAGLFTGRTMMNFGLWDPFKKFSVEKVKTQ